MVAARPPLRASFSMGPAAGLKSRRSANDYATGGRISSHARNGSHVTHHVASIAAGFHAHAEFALRHPGQGGGARKSERRRPGGAAAGAARARTCSRLSGRCRSRPITRKARRRGSPAASRPNTRTTRPRSRSSRRASKKTLDFVASVPAAEIDGSEEKPITLTVGGNPMTFTGRVYLAAFRAAELLFPRHDRLRHSAP